MKWRVGTRATGALGLGALALACLSAPAAAAPPSGKALADRIDQLDGELKGLRAESEQISGTASPREGLRFAENRVAGLRARYDELDEAIERAGGNDKDLAKYRKEFADKSVITGGDVAGEVGEKVVETAVKETLSVGASRVLGALGLALDALEYGGKWALKQGDLSALDDAVAQSRVNLHDLYDVAIGLSGQINAALDDVKRMKEIVKRDDEIYPEYALLRERQRLENTRATRGAVLRRDADAAGDAEEQKKYSKESAKQGIRAVPQLPDHKPRPSGQKY